MFISSASKIFGISVGLVLFVLLIVSTYSFVIRKITKTELSSFVLISEPVEKNKAVETDPFGKQPIENDVPHCPAEERLKFSVTLPSLEAFIDFLRNDPGRVSPRLDNFRSGLFDEIDWKKVSEAVQIERVRERTVYILSYEPEHCFSIHTLKMTEDGFFSHYGCCGR